MLFVTGEDALLNLSAEHLKNGKIGGYIRIRSKAQGIALSLGDKITNFQRGARASVVAVVEQPVEPAGADSQVVNDEEAQDLDGM